MATWPLVYRHGERLQIVLEQPCLQYRIDAYIPALRIAVEIDEPHHDRQVDDDALRQGAIEGQLHCEFRRLRVEGGEASLYAQLAALSEELDHLAADLPIWQVHAAGAVGNAAQAMRQGGYTADNLQRLMDARIPELVQEMLNDLAFAGVDTDTQDVKPLNRHNGELGFVVRLRGITFVVSVRPNRSIKALVIDWAPRVPERLGLELSERPKHGSVNYYTIKGMARSDHLTIEETLRKLVEFNDILNNPDARFTEEGAR